MQSCLLLDRTPLDKKISRVRRCEARALHPASQLKLYYITNGQYVTRDRSALEANVFSRQYLKSFTQISFGLQSFLSIMDANLNRKRRLSVTDEVAQSSRDTQKRDSLHECAPAKVRKLAFDSKVSSHF